MTCSSGTDRRDVLIVGLPEMRGQSGVTCDVHFDLGPDTGVLVRGPVSPTLPGAV